jgi:hypothetical protein
MRVKPTDWTVERVQEYFVWARKVVDGLTGVNKRLEDALDEIFLNGTFTVDGSTYKCIPQ